MPARLVAASGVAMLCAVFSPARAEPAPPYSALIQQAQLTAPRLAESDANIRAAEGASVQAAVRPNPSVGLEAENVGRGTSYNGLSQEQTTLSVIQPFEIGGQRAARISAAGAELETARATREQARADFAYDLAIAYMTAELAGRRADLAMESLDRAEEDERAARALVNAGREADLRAVQANAATTAAEADLESARADATEAFVRLSGLVGALTPYTGVSQSLLDHAPDFPRPPMVTGIVSPGVRAAEAARTAAAQRVAVERTRAIPDISVSLGVRRFAGENAKAVVAGVSVPLPLFNNNSGNITTAEAELAAAEARLSAVRLSAEADFRAAVVQAIAAERRLNAADGAEQAANEAYRLARIGYDAGRTPLVELLAARRGLTDAQLRSLEGRAARVRAEASLARLTGRIPFGENP
ncbi:MAG TPA: TolC family protein [Micropepsaceae bacterium]|nr:TolC family protein [Micropepsaceae bacterium]